QHYNDTETPYPQDRTVATLFEEQAGKVPHRIAAAFGNRCITYSELNTKANQLACRLKEKGTIAGTIVGIMTPCSLEMLLGIIAILKAGAAYLPIDPANPQERIRYILKDGNVNRLLIRSNREWRQDESKRQGEQEPRHIDVIDMEERENYSGSGTNPGAVGKATDPVYVIYTSGSTGKPKGVMLENKNVVSLVKSLQITIYQKYTAGLNIALVAPYTFDASVKQIFATILGGHSLKIVPEETRRIGPELIEFYNRGSVNISDGTPTLLLILAETTQPLSETLKVKQFIIGGETLAVKTVNRFLGDYIKNKPAITPVITNIYGPTECCVDSVCYTVTGGKTPPGVNIPIGKVMPNEKIYILDKYMKPVPTGTAGEMCISGEGVARGYINKPQLTAEKFIPNPYEKNKRMYRTGDFARWRKDGNIDFLGRCDNQVKIRGYRMEPGEIELQLAANDKIKEAVVAVREDENKNLSLCAYFTASREMTAEQVKQYLSKKLPAYMVPAYYVQLEEIPLNRHGKVDMRALPAPRGNIADDNQYTVPETEMEKVIAQTWQEILEIDRVGIHDNFFDIGGHSLNIIRVNKKLNEIFNKEL
ncbi:MAG: amino acid adenylation domain-containing protein, partial [bacterium]|nr:amino acid adenylation domain-containing protein [bacterium]